LNYTYTPTTLILTLSLHDALPIYIRIAKDLVSKDQICDIYDMTRLATLQDLKSIAKDFGCSLDSFDIKALEKVHMVKPKIYKELDRKSTRLNSSHVSISYAVFCLK